MDVHIITFHEQPLGEVLMSIYTLTNSVLKSLLTGIQYFTFDALDAMLEHATDLNTIRNGVQVHCTESCNGLIHSCMSVIKSDCTLH